MRPKDLPDLVHIEAIRRALWRPRGGAALMVGSGFSHNARPVSGAVRKMPLWNELTRELYCDLHPDHPRDWALPLGTSSLQLAEEYQQTFGPARLDERLRQLLPDDRYEPGALHKLLLDLPWRDVFTTNYDRLLERTRLTPGRTYQVVLTPSDIPQSRPPRLVKLHGSFPAQRPFILTEEEYRRYPREFGPFVNLVQQAIMEHTFCLLGFSGEDPNFLAWAGWVRDHLGPGAPPIYLCGVLDCTTSKRRYFESKKVIPVDLGPLFPRDEEFGERRHERALEWFLLSLHQGQPVDRSPWPDVGVPRLPSEPSDGLPPLLDAPSVPEKPLLEPSHDKPVDAEWVQKLLASWRSRRKTYPGWVICPELNRYRLASRDISVFWGRTGEEFIQAAAALTLAQQLDALAELVWHLRRLRLPLAPLWADRIETVLESINPYPQYIDLLTATLRRDHSSEGSSSLDWDSLLRAWVELGLVLVNDAWHHWKWERFDHWMKRLERVVRLRPEWHAAWCFELCWKALMHLDAEGTREALGDWPEMPECPFSEAKRASVLAELGDHKEAERVAQGALAAVRAGTDSEEVDYRSRSEEWWILLLCRQLGMGSGDHSQVGDLNRQLESLREARCDPLGDLRDLNDRLRRQQDRPPGAYQTRKRDFDPGVERFTSTLSSSMGNEWVWIQTYHDAPLLLPAEPDRAVLDRPLKMLWRATPLVAAAFYLRSGSGKELEENAFGRADVAGLPDDVVQNLCRWLMPPLRRAIASLPPVGVEGPRDLLSERALKGLELLSRLTFRMSHEQRSEMLALALEMYRSERIRTDLWLFDPLHNLFRRLIFAGSEEESFSWLPKFLQLPFPEEIGFSIHDLPFVHPDPVAAYFTHLPRRSATEAERASWAQRANELITLAQEAGPEVRGRAIPRLALLLQVHGLTQKQVTRFLGALWKETEETGFPAHTNLAPWVLLELPERQSGDNERAVRNYLLGRDLIPHGLQGKARDWQYYFQTLIISSLTVWPAARRQKPCRIDWSQSEAALLFHKIEQWWPKAAARIERRRENLLASPDSESVVEMLLTAVATVLLPRLDAPQQQAAARLIQTIEQAGFSLLGVLPALRAVLAIPVDEAAEQIRYALLGSTDEEVLQAAQAIRLWHLLARGGHGPEPPAFLLDDLMTQMANRREPGLEIALTFTRRFLEEIPEHLGDTHMGAICRGLDHLRIETAPPSQGSSENLKQRTTPEPRFPPEECIVLRASASALAASLREEYARRGVPIPESVERWKQIATMDVLPEVRHPWVTAGLPQVDDASS